MNVFQASSKDTSDLVPLYLPQQLFLKPWAKLTISLHLPNVAKVGKSISHLEIMEKLRELVKPEQFDVLKVGKTTLEFVRFEAELESKNKLELVVTRLDNKTIKLKNFKELMRVRAAVFKSDFPSRQIWDGFFDDAKDMDEMKAGERPDTVHLSNLPTKWFIPYYSDDIELPSERIFYKIFEKFGPIRYVDIPLCDPYRKKMKDHISGIKHSDFENKDFFEGYVQFKDYMGFVKCMDAFRDMKLARMDEDELLLVQIKVDFDRSKHLSDASIRRREIVRDRLVKKQQDKEEKDLEQLEEKRRKEAEEKKRMEDTKRQKEERRKLREEKRKAAILEKLKIRGADEINAKIAKEEKKLLKAQRKLESIRLIEELFRRMKEKSNNVEERQQELTKVKRLSEIEFSSQREKLNSAIKGRIILKSMLQPKNYNDYSSTSSEDEEKQQKQHVTPVPSILPSAEAAPPPFWYGYPVLPNLYQPQLHPQYAHTHRGRGYRGIGTSSRGYYNHNNYRGRNYGRRFSYNNSKYSPQLERQYVKYFSKFSHEHDDRNDYSKSRSRSLSRSESRSRSRRRSYSRSRSESGSRSRRRHRKSRKRTDQRREKRRSRSSSRERRRKSRSRSKSKSVISSKGRRTRSKSWSLPKDEQKRDSWSKTPEKK